MSPPVREPIRILFRDARGLVTIRTVKPVGLRHGWNSERGGYHYGLYCEDVESRQYALLELDGILAAGETEIARVLALKRLSDQVPPLPWRTVLSNDVPDEVYLTANKRDEKASGLTLIMGRANRPSVEFLKAAAEFCRSQFPEEIRH